MKVFLFILTACFISTWVFAKDTYFDFNFPSRLLLANYVYKIKLAYELYGANENEFIVIPVTENGSVEIYDESKNVWIKPNNLRSTFPSLSPELEVKITNFNGAKMKICFEVQHSKTALLYKTPCKTYWNRSIFNGYIDRLNDKILKWEK